MLQRLTLLIVSLSGVTHAAPITWGSATPISTDIGNSADVSTNGDLIEAYNAVPNDGIADAVAISVNGVTFTPTTSLLDADPKNSGASDFSTTTNDGDSEYDNLLSTLEYGGGTGPVTLTIGDGDGDASITGDGLLITGESYEIQVWFSDTRTAQNDRVTPVGDGHGNTVDLNDQYSIGTFTADGTTQAITLASPAFGQAHINAYQIRQLTGDLIPTVNLSTSADPVSAPYTLDVTFNGNVDGLTATDFVVTNGTASSVSPAVGPATVYTVTITPSDSGYVTVELPAASVQNTSSIDNLASNILSTLHLPVGSMQATPTLSTAVVDPASAPYTVNIVFDEDVTGLELADFNVVGGTASDLLPAVGPASTYTVTITPTAEGDVEIIIPAESVLDVDENIPNLTSNTLVTQYVPSSIPVATLLNPLTGSVISGTYTIQISFSEDVTGLELTDFILTNATAANLTPAAGPSLAYTLDITPTAPGLISVLLPADSVLDDDGENQTNPDSNILYANNLSTNTFTSGLLDLSGRDAPGLGAGESSGFFENPKTFDSVSDLSLNDIPWTDGVNTGTFDLSFVATSSLNGLKRGGRGAFGAADGTAGSALVDNGSSILFDSLTVTDRQGGLAGMTISNLQFVAIYLGNELTGDAATINGLVANGAPSGITTENMRTDIELAPTATIAGTGGLGYSINAIDITFNASPGTPPQIVDFTFDASGQVVLTATGLGTAITYELRYSPDLQTPFSVIPGTSKIPASETDTFTDPSPPLPGNRFYQLWVSP